MENIWIVISRIKSSQGERLEARNFKGRSSATEFVESVIGGKAFDGAGNSKITLHRVYRIKIEEGILNEFQPQLGKDYKVELVRQ